MMRMAASSTCRHPPHCSIKAKVQAEIGIDCHDRGCCDMDGGCQYRRSGQHDTYQYVKICTSVSSKVQVLRHGRKEQCYSCYSPAGSMTLLFTGSSGCWPPPEPSRSDAWEEGALQCSKHNETEMMECVRNTPTVVFTLQQQLSAVQQSSNLEGQCTLTEMLPLPHVVCDAWSMLG
jgi:hypothetical protein